MSAIQRWLLGLAAPIAAVTVSYLWLDRPLALLAHERIAHHDAFVKLTHIPDPLLPSAAIAFVALGLWVLAGRPMTTPLATALMCSISLVMAAATKNLLKAVFGRTWPETWVHNNPSFIRDGVYGFNLFHGGEAYASFPSGHTAVTCAVMSVLWISYPRLRPLYVVAVLAVAIGLIGANYHFLSDVLGGAFVGISTGRMTTTIWRARERRDGSANRLPG